MSTELLDQLETRIGALTDQVMLMKMEIDELKAQQHQTRAHAVYADKDFHHATAIGADRVLA